MANAIPVHSKGAKEEVKIEVQPHGDFKDAKERQAAVDALLQRAQQIAASEVPVIPDELVGSIGQASSYGKFKSVTEVPYDVINRKGDPTGEVRTVIRIDH